MYPSRNLRVTVIECYRTSESFSQCWSAKSPRMTSQWQLQPTIEDTLKFYVAYPRALTWKNRTCRQLCWEGKRTILWWGRSMQDRITAGPLTSGNHPSNSRKFRQVLPSYQAFGISQHKRWIQKWYHSTTTLTEVFKAKESQMNITFPESSNS